MEITNHLLDQHGLLLINKPPSISSFEVIRQLRKKLGIRKMGHSGTLDPFATGLLIILVGEATKFQDLMMRQEKEYRMGICLGRETDTLDPTGKMVEEKKTSLEQVEPKISSVIDQHFIGVIDQVPPVFSAIKVQGKRAYQLSRRGEKVNLKSRKVQIKSIDVEQIKPLEHGVELTLRVVCGSGCYMRSLARDLARHLKTVGMVDWLERTQIGKYRTESLSPWTSLLQLEQGQLMDQMIEVEDFLSGTAWHLSSYQLEKLRFGHFEFLQGSLKQGFHLLYFNSKLMAVVHHQPEVKKNPSMIYNLVKYS